MSSRDRDKASDVFRDTEYLFSKKVSFAEAFPSIEDLHVVVRHRGHYGVNTWDREQHYGKNVGEYIDCTNPVCYNGGFSIGSYLRQMVASDQTHFEEDFISCQGYEGSPKGRRRYRSCTNYFSVVIDIKYKDSQVSGAGT